MHICIFFCLKRTVSLFYNTFSALEDLTYCFSHYDKLITILCRNYVNSPIRTRCNLLSLVAVIF